MKKYLTIPFLFLFIGCNDGQQVPNYINKPTNNTIRCPTSKPNDSNNVESIYQVEKVSPTKPDKKAQAKSEVESDESILPQIIHSQRKNIRIVVSIITGIIVLLHILCRVLNTILPKIRWGRVLYCHGFYLLTVILYGSIMVLTRWL